MTDPQVVKVTVDSQSAWYGRNRKVKLNALDKALEYIEVYKSYI